jgi:hypothetical protein
MVKRLYAHLFRSTVSVGLTTESDLEHISIKTTQTKKGRTISEFLFDQKDSSNANFVPWSRATVVSDDERDEEPTGELAASNVPRSEISSRERGDPRAKQISIRTTKEPTAKEGDGRALPANLPDFARLMEISAYEEDVRNALLESALERSRPQLDARISGDEFCDTLVTPKFNYPDFQSLIRGIPRGIGAKSVSCTIAETEICLTPQIAQSGPELKRWY